MGAHRNFVDIMYKCFGLTEHPGYCTIRTQPLFGCGGFSIPNIITIDPKRSYVEHTLYHESSHFLHYSKSKHMLDSLLDDERISLSELVADLGTMIFLIEDGKGHEIKIYVGESERSNILIARELLSQQNILERIVNSDFKEARKIVASITKKELKW